VHTWRKLKAGLGGTMDNEVHSAGENGGCLSLEAEPFLADIALDGEHHAVIEAGSSIWSRLQRTAIVAKEPADPVDERNYRMPPLGELGAEFASDQSGSTGHEDPQRGAVPHQAWQTLVIRSAVRNPCDHPTSAVIRFCLGPRRSAAQQPGEGKHCAASGGRPEL
jgi:hypothetical protein